MTIHVKRVAECEQCHKRIEVPDDVPLFEGWGWYEVRFGEGGFLGFLFTGVPG